VNIVLSCWFAAVDGRTIVAGIGTELQKNPAAASAIAAFLSALVALAAVIIAPSVSLIATNRQVRATVRSTNRQAWINELRDEVAKALSLLTEAMALKKSSIPFEQRVKTLVEYDYHLSKVQLLINPNEADHRDLCNKLAAAMTALRKYLIAEGNDTSELEAVAKTIVTICQPILKREWERVKRVQ